MVEESPRSREIAPDEVKGWFANCRRPRPDEALCAEIAGRLTKMRRPSDPRQSFGVENYDELLKRGMIKFTKQDPESPWVAVVLTEVDDRWWDFEGARNSANTLLDSIPSMLQHWETLRRWPETLDGYEVIKALEHALARALPYIEWPFGEGERQDPPRPSSWHMPAVLIANIIAEALIRSGRLSTSTVANSTVVKVVHKALIRLEYPDIDASAIAMYLTRRSAKFGPLG
jgi:hypothetical protein